jgi:hypothetical protein
MKYSLILSLATIATITAPVCAMENEPTYPKTMTFQERREKSRQPVTKQQMEQSKLKPSTTVVTQQDIDDFNTQQQLQQLQQQQQAEESETEEEKESHKKWYQFWKK